MTKKLVEILEAARKHHVKSNFWFSRYQETADPLYLDDCKEQDDIARGLLEAYEIMTGKKVYLYEIGPSKKIYPHKIENGNTENLLN